MRSPGRWLAIALGVVLIAVIEILSDSVLDAALPFPLDTILVVAVVLVVAVAASTLAFRSIDGLADALRTRNAELEAREEAGRALHDVTIAIAALHDVDEILRATVDHARRLLAADAALLALAASGDRTTVRATSGRPGAFAGDSSTGELVGAEPADLFAPAFRTGLLVAALQHGDRTLGWLAVGSRRERSYEIGDLETLASLAGQAAIAIEQDRLQRQMRELAVRRERERIARDLHDGIAQVLGYVNTKSQAVGQLIEAGRVGDATTQLGELAAAARSVYVDVRTVISTLAAPPVRDEPLATAINRIATRFADSAKVAIDTEVDARTSALRVTPDVGEQVLAIVGEALTNVRKHAGAGRVAIRLRLEGATLSVGVSDDGRGFDPAADPAGDWPQYGRQAMTERAAAIGGSVDWSSAPGHGTTVRLRVPLAPVEAEASPTRP